MPQWRCLQCGSVHSSHRSECSECGHTILQQHRAGGGNWVGRLLTLLVIAPFAGVLWWFGVN